MPIIHRRGLVLGAAALAAGASARAEPQGARDQAGGPAVSPPPAAGQAGPLVLTIPLWPAAPPGGPGPGGSEVTGLGGDVTNIVQPRLVMHRPAKPNGMAMLIVGGGGYRRIAIDKESRSTADWLQRYGVTTFTLYYRLPNGGWPLLAPFQDAQRAMRVIRARADWLGLDEGQVGIIGYSAGGHLAGMTSVRPSAELYKPVDAADDLPARPDFTGLIYPVLTMMAPNRTRMSTATLLGADPTPDMSAQWSVEQHVTDDAPTTFLVHATDDPIAPVENSLMMFSALRRAHVPVEMHVFRSGGHGFNIGQPRAEGSQWTHLFATWAGFANPGGERSWLTTPASDTARK